MLKGDSVQVTVQGYSVLETVKDHSVPEIAEGCTHEEFTVWNNGQAWPHCQGLMK